MYKMFYKRISINIKNLKLSVIRIHIFDLLVNSCNFSYLKYNNQINTYHSTQKAFFFFSLREKGLPRVFNNFGVFYKGSFETVNLLDITYLKRILNK